MVKIAKFIFVVFLILEHLIVFLCICPFGTFFLLVILDFSETVSLIRNTYKSTFIDNVGMISAYPHFTNRKLNDLQCTW